MSDQKRKSLPDTQDHGEYGRVRSCPLGSFSILCDGPRHGGVSHAPLLSDRPGTLTPGDAFASNAPLQIGQLGFATHVHSALPGSSSAVVGTLHDPLAFLLRQGAQESNEANADEPIA